MIRRTDNRQLLLNNPEYIDSSAENAKSLKHDNKPNWNHRLSACIAGKSMIFL